MWVSEWQSDEKYEKEKSIEVRDWEIEVSIWIWFRCEEQVWQNDELRKYDVWTWKLWINEIQYANVEWWVKLSMFCECENDTL